MTKSFLFLLFLFGIGYSVGPQFMQALKRDGLKPVLLAVVVGITGLAASILVAKALRLDPGFAAGLMSGALTQSAAMGTATDAVNGLPLPEADRALFVAHIAVADAVCYIFGYAGVILFCTVVAPALLRIDLRAEALKLEQALGMKPRQARPGLRLGGSSSCAPIDWPEGSPLAGLTVAAAEARVPEHRLFIHRLRRDGRILEVEPGMTLQAGRRDRDLRSAPGHGRAGRTSRRGGRGQGASRRSDPGCRRPAHRVRSLRAGVSPMYRAEEWTRGPVLAIGEPRRPGGPDRGRCRAAARRPAACGRPGARRAESGRDHRRHRCPELDDRFHRAGTCDLSRRRRRRARDLFGRRHENFAEHQRRHAARRASGRPLAHALSACSGGFPTAPSPS